MSFHTATICADCSPPVVALSTGYGSRCPKCGTIEEGPRMPHAATLADGALARRVITDVAIRSDGDARLLAELARRLLEREPLRQLYAESRDYVAALRRERDDLVAAAQQHVDRANQAESKEGEP